jgi:hypothetical protein
MGVTVWSPSSNQGVYHKISTYHLDRVLKPVTKKTQSLVIIIIKKRYAFLHFQ